MSTSDSVSHIKDLQKKLQQAAESIEALESEHDALLLEAEETEFWPRPWRLAPPPGGHGEAAEPMQKLIADGGLLSLSGRE